MQHRIKLHPSLSISLDHARNRPSLYRHPLGYLTSCQGAFCVSTMIRGVVAELLFRYAVPTGWMIILRFSVIWPHVHGYISVSRFAGRCGLRVLHLIVFASGS
jgi:hypothetical protein